uniref:Reverse transcriptase Ty1/copia-type domain-containing protein n=1 Tax=Rhizophora mucronata TaxID=61149 RepID=A0A2P2IVG9_RHIMU
MFVKHSLAGKWQLDDVILRGDCKDKIANLKKLLAKEFKIKDLGHLKYFLGMEMAQSRSGISVSQRKNALNLLNVTGMLRCKSSDTPMNPINKVGVEKGSPSVDKSRY